MLKKILLTLFPPAAVCRYGCANSCILPITGFWAAGVLLLYYFFSHALQSHNLLLSYGSLAGGITLVLLAIIWAQTNIARNQAGSCSAEPDQGRKPLCRVMPRASEIDPLDEIEKAKNL